MHRLSVSLEPGAADAQIRPCDQAECDCCFVMDRLVVQTTVTLDTLRVADTAQTAGICVYILIAVGAVMMLVGFLGCYGAIQESQCLLGTISKELINFYDSAYIKAVDVSGSPSKDAAIKVLDVFHNTLDCCGKGDDTALFRQVVGTLCPRKSQGDFLKSQSCHDKLIELFSEKLHLIGLAALVVAVIMIFEMIFTMVLCCGIRNSPGAY
ncbi:hypothetical protein F2P81_006915 [Scophthalmus maximus]|uniref:Uncharacterized protein n=1 Tax=Scophthalmus maximus TaxID=52904 RepID=A0A6A4T4B9_SCOMX|nr:hypothetical protein F2P81_006915 [Scophthalmus maximus]